MTAIGNNGQSAQLFPGETITASVVGVPAASVVNATPAADNLLITPVKGDFAAGFTTAVASPTVASTAGLGATISAATTAAASPDNARLAAGAQPTRPNSVYYFAVSPSAASTTNAIDAGVYTIQIRLTDVSGFVTSYSVTVNFVTSAADSGAVIVPTVTGRFIEGESVTAWTATRNLSATLRNAAGGRIFAAGTTSFTPVAPVLSAAITTSTGVVRIAETATIADSGAAAVDHAAIITDFAATTTPVNDLVTAATRQAANVKVQALNGTYGVLTTAVFGAPTATTGDLLRVRYGSTSATAALTIVPAPVAGTVGTTSVTATGAVKTAAAATVPLTTRSLTFSVKVTNAGVGQTGYPVFYSLTNGASCSAGDMSIATTTAPVRVLTDAEGNASVTVTNAFPLTGCTVAVTWSGATTMTNATQTVTFSRATAAAALPTPGGNFQALLKSSNTITWTIVDQFGAVMPGATVQIGLSGANNPAAAPVTIPAVVSNANGQVSYTVRDALAVSATATSTTGATDTVSVTAVNAVAPTSTGAVTITYRTALETVASLYSTYKYASANAATLIPTTVLAGSAGTGILNSGLDRYDWSVAQTATDVAAIAGVVSLNFEARTAAAVAVTGIPTVVTATGGFILGSDGKLATTRTIFANENILVVGAKTGVVTVAATNGALTSTARILFVNAVGDARVLSATESNGTITARTVDFQGNPVSGVTVSVALSAGAGRLGNGSTSSSFTTAADGTVSFDVTGAATATVSITSAKAFLAAGFGDADSTISTPGIAAGVSSVTVATNGNTVVADTAQAAADAAAEATDAANAATDAANAAAEAADAATAAAQDAADAVAALATSVEAMVRDLKRQITALTNLVIKIQRKVRA
jgi:hypothetical protein